MSPTRYMCTAAFHSPASMKWYSASDSLDSASSSCRKGSGREEWGVWHQRSATSQPCWSTWHQRTLARCRWVSVSRSGWCLATRRITSSNMRFFLYMVMARSGCFTAEKSLEEEMDKRTVSLLTFWTPYRADALPGPPLSFLPLCVLEFAIPLQLLSSADVQRHHFLLCHALHRQLWGQPTGEVFFFFTITHTHTLTTCTKVNCLSVLIKKLESIPTSRYNNNILGGDTIYIMIIEFIYLLIFSLATWWSQNVSKL